MVSVYSKLPLLPYPGSMGYGPNRVFIVYQFQPIGFNHIDRSGLGMRQETVYIIRSDVGFGRVIMVIKRPIKKPQVLP